MTRTSRTCCPLLLIFLCIPLLSPGISAASEPHGEAAPRRFVAGIKAGYLGGLAGGELNHSGGGGLFLEWAAVPHWLSLELNVKVLGGHGTYLPIDLLLVMPFHLTDAIHPYVGIGPAVGINLSSSSAAFGFATAAGAHFWMTRRIGLLAELNYAMINDHGVHHEIGGQVGLCLGW